VTTSPAALLDALVAAFPEAAAAERSRLRVVRAPGRVNLIGEHTDYNEGLALPAAISLAIDIALLPTDDVRVELRLASTGERGAFDLAAIGERRGTWLDYVAGTAWALREAGCPVRGFRGVIGSTIPSGAGLSSSAAIELASAWALSGGERPPLDPMTLARTAQRAENEYVGVHCGLLDQFAVTMGRAGMALHLDCRSLDWHPVPVPADLELVVCHSGSPRKLGTSAYNARRAECARAVATIAEREPGVTALRDVDLPMLERHRDRIDEVAFARALHVVTEDLRVVETEAALEAGDRDALGRLFAASHDSLRERFEVSSPALDALVEIAGRTPGVVGARLTGAGFGGCTINLVERGRAADLRAAVDREYARRTGLAARVFAVDAADGAGVVDPEG
ncbi:MAG TPA: galactokinase, partial [Candidatus Limnocylindrales bacterium]|nr:galactokinase [Candidatus Limnocylindrales bacterium]